MNGELRVPDKGHVGMVDRVKAYNHNVRVKESPGELRGRSISWNGPDLKQGAPVPRIEKLKGVVTQTKENSLVTNELADSFKKKLGETPRNRRSRSFEDLGLLRSSEQKKAYFIHTSRVGSRVYYDNPIKGGTLRNLLQEHQQEHQTEVIPPKNYTSKKVVENIQEFWTQDIVQIKTHGSLVEIFYQNVLLPSLRLLQTTISQSKALKDESILDGSTSLRKHLKSFLSPLEEDTTGIANRLQLIKTIIAITETEHKAIRKADKKILKVVRHFSDEKFKTLADWGIAGNFYWKKSRETSCSDLDCKDIKRSLIPNDKFVIKTVHVNNRPVLSNNDEMSTEDAFKGLISALHDIHPLKTSLNLEQQVAFFLFFADPQNEPYQEALQCMTTSPINWEQLQKILNCSFDSQFKKFFEKSKKEYEAKAKDFNLDDFLAQAKSTVDPEKEVEYNAFKALYSKTCYAFDWTGLQKLLTSPIDYFNAAYLNTSVDLTNDNTRYKNYLINLLLKAMVPGFEILQIGSTEMEAKNLDTKLRTVLKLDESFSLKGINPSEKTFSVGKKEGVFSILMPKHFNICAASDKDIVYARLEMDCNVHYKMEDSNLKWKIESRLIITSKAIEDDVVSKLLSCFQKPVSKKLKKVFTVKPLLVFKES